MLDLSSKQGCVCLFFCFFYQRERRGDSKPCLIIFITGFILIRLSRNSDLLHACCSPRLNIVERHKGGKRLSLSFFIRKY